jgi:hypothetical protein
VTGNHTAGLSITHFAGQIAIVAKINVQINWGCSGMTLIVGTVLELDIARTLLDAVRKCCLGKDHTFLIAPKPAAVSIV